MLNRTKVFLERIEQRSGYTANVKAQMRNATIHLDAVIEIMKYFCQSSFLIMYCWSSYSLTDMCLSHSHRLCASLTVCYKYICCVFKRAAGGPF